MKRHVLLVLLRLILAGIIFFIPFGHPNWADVCHDRDTYRFLMTFALTGISAAVLMIVLGSFIQCFFRTRPVRYSILGDLGLFLVFVILLISIGLLHKNYQPHPNHGLESTGVPPAAD